MELSDRFAVNATADAAWAFFWDLPRVAGCLPGCESIEAIGDGAYRAQMTQRVGPFQVAMSMEVSIQESVEKQRVVVTGQGKDRHRQPTAHQQARAGAERTAARPDRSGLRNGLQSLRQTGNAGQHRRKAQSRRDTHRVQPPHSLRTGVIAPSSPRRRSGPFSPWEKVRMRVRAHPCPLSPSFVCCSCRSDRPI